MTALCAARYPRKTGDRIVECSLNVGHTGDHIEFGTGIDWPQRGPLPPEDERDAALTTAARTDTERVHRAERLIADLADILDPHPPGPGHVPSYATRTVYAVKLLHRHGIHPGQRDADGLTVPPPHDDDCRVCEAEAVTS